jgi:hypothetical protein
MEEDSRAAQTRHSEVLETQGALIDQFERMVLHMKGIDRYACEESLRRELPGVFEKLVVNARTLFLASEQMYRTPGFAAPAQVVHSIATAFELQLKYSVIKELFDYLKRRGVRTLQPLPDRTDNEIRRKPLWAPYHKADKTTLGEIKTILRHNDPVVQEFFDSIRLDRSDIQRAVEGVLDHRNTATHGDPLDFGNAEAIRNEWIHWKKRAGGIFSVFFCPESV